MNTKLFLYAAMLSLMTGSLFGILYACFVDPDADQDFWPEYHDSSADVYCIRIHDPLAMNAGGLGMIVNGRNWPYATRSEDPPPDPWSYRLPDWASGIKRWEWNFGDGSNPVVEDIVAGINGDGDPCINAITEHPYEAPDCYILTLKVTDDDAFEGGGNDRDGEEEFYILAFDLDITTSGGDEGYIQVNDDDDDSDAVIDYDDGYNKDGITGNADDSNPNEGDLQPIYLSFEPSDWSSGKVELSVLDGSSAHLKIWDDSKKGQGNLIIPNGSEYKASWSPNQLPETLWVEAVDMPSSNPTTLSMRYVINGSQQVNGVENVEFTVVKVNVDAFLGEKDELNPGLYIAANWDDDDGDGWQPNDNPPNGVYTGDKADYHVYDAQKAPNGDDDFWVFFLSIAPSNLSGNVRLTYPSNVAVWETRTKKKESGTSSEVPSGSEYSVAQLPKTLYVEGVSGSSTFRDVELKATWLPKSFSDFVKVTVFEVDLTGKFGFGGQQLDNEVKHSYFEGSSDNNGKISWDDGNGNGEYGDPDPNCKYFHNCMECQGTVSPSGVTS